VEHFAGGTMCAMPSSPLWSTLLASFPLWSTFLAAPRVQSQVSLIVLQCISAALY
jgi:hypothetical protein